MRRLFSLMVIAVFFSLFLSGCGGAPTMHYYQLSPAVLSAEQTVEPLPALAVGVGPITIPEMLKRQEIVTRTDDNKLRVASQHRWAGMLEKDLNAVIIDNLGRQLGTDQLLSFPWAAYFEPDYRVAIDILDLTGNSDNLVTLRAGWSIIDSTGAQMLFRKVSTYFDGALEGKTIAIWGLAFKPNTDDMREASSRRLMEQLWQE